MRANPSILGFVWDPFLALLLFLFYFIAGIWELSTSLRFGSCRESPCSVSAWLLKAELCRHLGVRRKRFVLLYQPRNF